MIPRIKTALPVPKAKEYLALAKRITMECYKRGLLLIAPIGFYGNVLRVAPPLVLTISQAKIGCDIMEEVFKKLG